MKVIDHEIGCLSSKKMKIAVILIDGYPLVCPIIKETKTLLKLALGVGMEITVRKDKFKSWK